ncbi:hypothetical protein [uncultured Desulfosarcina sp.]|uniref:hypothetical protein n=1 Tax=uncultured Desulfosarcina sp. TaxID=218289 RepID=UPI0029C9AD3F|nr:hypothetical protein [uncultured Desulfosarcina sp.]
MHPEFKIDCRNSRGNLHVRLCGAFNGMCAWELLKILRQHDGTGRVFVNTNGIGPVAGEGVELFRMYMKRRRIPRDWLYFKGKKGFKIAPDGSRVLICKKASQPVQIQDRYKPTKPTMKLVKNINRRTEIH